MSPIFSKDHFVDFFSISNRAYIPSFNDKKYIIEGWVRELRSGKLESLKEEEVKSRFVNDFFGDLLGFHYGSSHSWSLSEETKSFVDGTKPDATLGYFSRNKSDKDVRVVIEMKDAKTDLDAKQKRPGAKSSVDQAFEYVSKMGGNCRWVIVSNFKEIRFYHAYDRSKYQCYQLIDLTDDEVLKELLFFFHKDKLIAENRESKTDKYYQQTLKIQKQRGKATHIIDQLYESMRRFEGFGFVDPQYLSNLKPFNVLDQTVWHYTHRGLFTLNTEIHDLLNSITIDQTSITIQDDYLQSQKIRCSIRNQNLNGLSTF